MVKIAATDACSESVVCLFGEAKNGLQQDEEKPSCRDLTLPFRFLCHDSCISLDLGFGNMFWIIGASRFPNPRLVTLNLWKLGNAEQQTQQ